MPAQAPSGFINYASYLSGNDPNAYLNNLDEEEATANAADTTAVSNFGNESTAAGVAAGDTAYQSGANASNNSATVTQDANGVNQSTDPNEYLAPQYTDKTTYTMQGKPIDQGTYNQLTQAEQGQPATFSANDTPQMSETKTMSQGLNTHDINNYNQWAPGGANWTGGSYNNTLAQVTGDQTKAMNPGANFQGPLDQALLGGGSQNFSQYSGDFSKLLSGLTSAEGNYGTAFSNELGKDVNPVGGPAQLQPHGGNTNYSPGQTPGVPSNRRKGPGVL